MHAFCRSTIPDTAVESHQPVTVAKIHAAEVVMPLYAMIGPSYHQPKASSISPLMYTHFHQLLELYSLMKAVALVIESTQGTSAPSAPGGMQRMLGLVRELEEGRPLCLHDPSHHFQPADRRVEPGAERGRVTKQHAELTSVAQATRVKLRQAIMDRFASERFGQEHNRASHLFDMVSALNPCTRQLVYVNHLAPSAEVAAAVKEKIWSKLRSLAELIIDASRLSGKAVAQGEPPAKRPKISAPKPETDQSGFDFFDGAPEDMGGNGDTVQRPSLELAQEAIARYRTAQVMMLPAEEILDAAVVLARGASAVRFLRGCPGFSWLSMNGCARGLCCFFHYFGHDQRTR